MDSKACSGVGRFDSSSVRKEIIVLSKCFE